MLWFFSTVNHEAKKMQYDEDESSAGKLEPVISLRLDIDHFEVEFTEKQAEETIARLSAGLKALKAKAASGA